MSSSMYYKNMTTIFTEYNKKTLLYKDFLGDGERGNRPYLSLGRRLGRIGHRLTISPAGSIRFRRSILARNVCRHIAHLPSKTKSALSSANVLSVEMAGIEPACK